MYNYFLGIVLFLFVGVQLEAQTIVVAQYPDNPSGLVFYGDKLYISEYDANAITWVDITNQNLPLIPDYLIEDGLSTPWGLVVYEDFLYLLDGSSLYKVNLLSANPTKEFVLNTSVHNLAINGSDLYMAGNGEIWKVDLLLPTPMKELILDNIPSGYIGIVCKGDYLFYSVKDEGSIYKFDINSTPISPIQVVSGLIEPVGMVFNGNDLYIAEYFSGIWDSGKISKVDISSSNPTLELVTEDSLTGPWNLAIHDNELYISEFEISTVSKIAIGTPNFSLVTILPDIQTDNVENSGDYADDALVWIHPTNTDSSFMIGVDKSVNGRLEYFNSDGTRYGTSLEQNKKFNNLGIIYEYDLGGQIEDVVVASNRTDDKLNFFKIDTSSRSLESILGDTEVGYEPYGVALYYNREVDSLYCFASQRNSPHNVLQYLVTEVNGELNTDLVRTIITTSIVEGLIVDEQLGYLYVSQEDDALYKYNANPSGGQDRDTVDFVGSSNIQGADIEGVTLYSLTDSTGYLIISVQSDNTFNIYNRVDDNAFIGKFTIGSTNEIDQTEKTDGVFVSSTSFTNEFPNGVFIAHDGVSPSGFTNYKLLSWDSIADEFLLQSNPDYNPRTEEVVLPITLSSFTAKINNNNIVLSWIVQSEINNDYFTVERSKDAKQWHPIDIVDAIGLAKYESIDREPLLGINYYRLKQNDYDNQFSYSKIININTDLKKTISVFPNPAEDIIYINTNGVEINEIKLYNELGTDVYRFTTKKIQEGKLVLNLFRLNRGVYILKINNTIRKIYKK